MERRRCGPLKTVPDGEPRRPAPTETPLVYVGEIATSAEDYYLGHGEAPGRWVGPLAAEMGLDGEVDPEQFRTLLGL